MEIPLHHKNYQPPTSLELLFVLIKIVVTLVKFTMQGIPYFYVMNVIMKKKYENMNYCVLFHHFSLHNNANIWSVFIATPYCFDNFQ